MRDPTSECGGRVMETQTFFGSQNTSKLQVPPSRPVPDGLRAAERLAQVAHVLAVDEAHARLDRGGDAVRAAEVLGPHVARQAVGDVVGDWAIASASSSKAIRHATGPKISSCAMRIRLSTPPNTVGST